MASLFGFEIRRKIESENENVSLEPRTQDDGAVVVSAGGGGMYGTAVDLDGSIRNEAELVTKYRDMSFNPEVDAAVDEIVNELVCTDEEDIVKILLDNVKQSTQIKKAIAEEFDKTLELLHFNKKAYDITRKWYVDGRLYYHVVVDKDRLNEGILELRYIDPRKIRKVREVSKDRSQNPLKASNGDPLFEQTKVKNVYYLYNENGFTAAGGSPAINNGAQTGVKVARDAIIHVTSGITDNSGKLVLGYLHKAIKILNELTTLEQAVIIYRLCLVGDTRVKTIDGWKYIKDIKENDDVYSFTIDGLENSKVKKSWSTGLKETFEVKSKHFSVKGNDTHPILVLDNVKNTVEYIDIKDIIPNQHCFVYEKNVDNESQIELFDKRKNVIKLLNSEIWVNKNIQNKEVYIEELSKRIELKKSTVRNFLYGIQYTLEEDAHKILNDVELENIAILDVRKEKYYQNKLNLPQFIDEDFAKLFGFLIGDGSIDKYRIIFAEGIDKEQNIYYANLITKYFGDCNRANTKRKYSNWSCSNTLGTELLKTLGFVGDAHTKRFPSWIWHASDSIKKSFILGLCDADGHNSISKTGKFQSEIELCNKELIEDIKELWTDIGLSSGHIRHRIRKEQTRKFGTDFRTIPETESWTLFISDNSLPPFEKIQEVISCGEEEVYDIEVDHENHNFIGNGIVLHNSRAPERRVWYVDVGNLPKMKAEQYMTELMTKHKNRVVYDSATGTVVDDRKFTTMLEDYWLPRREGGRGTEVTTLPGGQTLGQLDDVLYFQKKFYGSLNIPVARLESTNPFQLGADTEISRQEIKFSKAISRMRVKFADLFIQIMEKQLILKGILTWDAWNEIAPHIKFDFARDNYFAEMKNNQILQNRYQLLSIVDPFQGKYVSGTWIRKNILKQNDDDIKQIDIEIAQEMNDPQYHQELNMPPQEDDGSGYPGHAMDVPDTSNQNSVGGEAKIHHRRGSNQYVTR